MFILLLNDSEAVGKAQRAVELEFPHSGPLINQATTWLQVRRMVTTRLPQMVIFDPYLSDEFDSQACGEFHAAFPSTVLVAYGEFSQNIGNSIAELLARGVHGVVVRKNGDALRPFASTLRRASEHGFKDRVLQTVRENVNLDVLRILSFLLDNTKAVLTPDAVARYSHCHPNTLRNRLQRAGMPPIGEIIVWTRLLHCAFLLEDSGRSIERVAGILSYPSAADMGNQLRRRLHLSPTQLRRSGGLDLVLARFHDRCQWP